MNALRVTRLLALLREKVRASAQHRTCGYSLENLQCASGRHLLCDMTLRVLQPTHCLVFVGQHDINVHFNGFKTRIPLLQGHLW